MNAIQYISMTLSILSSILVIIWCFQNQKYNLYAAPILIWIAHTIVYYAMLQLSVSGIFIKPWPTFFTDWSAVVRFHAILSVTASFTWLIDWDKLWMKLLKH